MEMNLLAIAKEFVSDHWILATLILVPVVVLITKLIGAAIFAYIRRPKSSETKMGKYFAESALLSPPLTRPAYSDRMAYVLAEMSDLAYYQFEGHSDLVGSTVKKVSSLKMADDTNVRKFLEEFAKKLMSEQRLSLESMKKVLSNSGFSLLDVINISETQGFVCKRVAKGEPPYLVLAFRGTEKKVSDWLTDARCVPKVKGTTKVHTGFHEAFTMKSNAKGKTVQDAIKEILNRKEAKDDNGKALPLFITGHSLGGALALLATRLVAPNINGACYTFGAPRVGNYEYFHSIKTPVYRIVNSSDIVPRVPPGAIMIALGYIVQAIGWVADFIPGVSRACDRIDAFLDKLSGYRHWGDQRYLSDVAEGRFDTVRLLLNPPMIDRVIWMWRRMAISIRAPFKSHGMNIYRRKLLHIANNRNKPRGD